MRKKDRIPPGLVRMPVVADQRQRQQREGKHAPQTGIPHPPLHRSSRRCPIPQLHSSLTVPRTRNIDSLIESPRPSHRILVRTRIDGH